MDSNASGGGENYVVRGQAEGYREEQQAEAPAQAGTRCGRLLGLSLALSFRRGRFFGVIVRDAADEIISDPNGRGRRIGQPDIFFVVQRFDSRLKFIWRQLPAPDDAVVGLLLTALQGDGFAGSEFGAQAAETAADGAGLDGVSPLRGGIVVGRVMRPHAQGQNHLGARAALDFVRHEDRLRQPAMLGQLPKIVVSGQW